jgi:hypothetical protein
MQEPGDGGIGTSCNIVCGPPARFDPERDPRQNARFENAGFAISRGFPRFSIDGPDGFRDGLHEHADDAAADGVRIEASGTLQGKVEDDGGIARRDGCSAPHGLSFQCAAADGSGEEARAV